MSKVKNERHSHIMARWWEGRAHHRTIRNAQNSYDTLHYFDATDGPKTGKKIMKIKPINLRKSWNNREIDAFCAQVKFKSASASFLVVSGVASGVQVQVQRFANSLRVCCKLRLNYLSLALKVLVHNCYSSSVIVLVSVKPALICIRTLRPVYSDTTQLDVELSWVASL